MVDDEKKDEDEKIGPNNVDFDNAKDIYYDPKNMVQQSRGHPDIVVIKDEPEVSPAKNVSNEENVMAELENKIMLTKPMKEEAPTSKSSHEILLNRNPLIQ